MKIAICGSMKLSQNMLESKLVLTDLGHKVTLPTHTRAYAKLDSQEEMHKESAQNKINEDLIREYFKEIKNSDSILVINKKLNGIENYIGGNSLIEMSFAHVLYKPIYLTNPIPNMSYTDEIIAMQPIILNGNLTLIK